MNNAILKKKQWRNCKIESICVRLANNEKGYLKWTLKRGYMSLKIFDNNLVAIP